MLSADVEGYHGSLRINMSMRVFMDVDGVRAYLWGSDGVYGSLCVFSGRLWGFKGIYVYTYLSIQVFMIIYGSLCMSMPMGL